MRECFLQSKMTKISESKVQVLLHAFLQGKAIATQALKSQNLDLKDISILIKWIA